MINEGNASQLIRIQRHLLMSRDDVDRSSKSREIDDEMSQETTMNAPCQSTITADESPIHYHRISNASSLLRIISRTNSVSGSSAESINKYSNINPLMLIKNTPSADSSRKNSSSNTSRESMYTKKTSSASSVSLNLHYANIRRKSSNISNQSKGSSLKYNHRMSSETDSITSETEGISSMFEENVSIGNEDYPIVQGRVANLRAKLSPHLESNLNASFNSTSSKGTKSDDDLHYMNVIPKSIQRRKSQVIHKFQSKYEDNICNKPSERLEDFPCVQGNVANLRAQLSPQLHLGQQSKTSSISSFNSTMSKVTKSGDDPHYMNVTPTSIQRQESIMINEIQSKFGKPKIKHSPSLCSNDSTNYEDYEIIDNFYINTSYENNNRGSVSDMNSQHPDDAYDEDAVSDATYESLDFTSDKMAAANGITNSELGFVKYNDGGAPVHAINSAYGLTIQELEESDRRKHARKLEDRVNELINSEQFYTDKLRIVVEEYVPEMVHVCNIQNPEFTKKNVFANIEEIYQMHSEEFLPQLLKNRSNLRRIAKTFIAFEDDFKMYITYARNKNCANRIYHENKDYFAEKQNAMGHKLNLASHLLEPIQRLPRYVLFLEELEKTYAKYLEFLPETKSGSSNSDNLSCSSSSDTEDADDIHETVIQCLKRASQSVKDVLTQLDNNITLVNIKNCRINLDELGKLLLHDEFMAVSESKYKRPLVMRCFLFEKSLILTIVDKTHLKEEIYIYHDCIEMSVLGITPPENENLNKFSVWYKKRTERNYELEASSKIILNWVNCISERLWDEAKMQKNKILSVQGEKWQNSLKSVRRPTLPTLPTPPPRPSTASLPTSAPSTIGRAKSSSIHGIHHKKKIRTTWYVEDYDN